MTGRRDVRKRIRQRWDDRKRGRLGEALTGRGDGRERV